MKKNVFDPSKDKKIGEWENPTVESNLIVSVHVYNGGLPKVQFSREVTIHGELTRTKSGRLTLSEFEWLSEISDDVKRLIANYKG